MKHLCSVLACIYIVGSVALAGSYPIPVVLPESSNAQKQQHLILIPKIILDNDFPDGIYGFSNKTRTNWGGYTWYSAGFSVEIEGNRVKSTTLASEEIGWSPAYGTPWIRETIFDGTLSKNNKSIVGSSAKSEILREYADLHRVSDVEYAAFDDTKLRNITYEVHLTSSNCSCNCTESVLNSIHLNVSLGTSNAGKAQGSLLFDVDIPDEQTCSKAKLAAYGLDGFTAAAAPFTQFLGVTLFTDIVTINANKFEVRQYLVSNCGPRNSDGYYVPSGSPLKVVSVENPTTNGQIDLNKVLVTDTVNGSAKTTLYTYTPATLIWTMLKAGADRLETLRNEGDPQSSIRVETRTIASVLGVIAYEEKNTYTKLAGLDGMQKLTQKIVGFSSLNAKITQWDYYTDQSSPGRFGFVKSRVDPTGYWEIYDYDTTGKLVKTVSPYLDSQITAPESQSRVVSVNYATSVPQETTVETVAGQEVRRQYRAFYTEHTETQVCTVAGAAWGAPTNLKTSEYKVDDDSQFYMSIKRRSNADGTVQLYGYQNGAGNASVITTLKEGLPNADMTDVTDGTITVTEVDNAGSLISEQKKDITSGLELSSAFSTQRDELGRPTRIDYGDGTYETTTYNCCGIESKKDRDGISTTYMPNQLGWNELELRGGISTMYKFNAHGDLLKTSRQGTDASTIVQSQSLYDTGGFRYRTLDALSQPTNYTEILDGSGHRVRTVTYPDNSTRIETYARDQSLLSVGGTNSHPLQYQYGVDTAGAFTKEIRVGVAGAVTEWTKSYRDLAGRNVKTVLADNAVRQTFYNNLGQMVRQVDADSVTTLFQYNLKGEQEYVALDMDRNGNLDLTGTDRVTRTVNDVVTAHGGPVQRGTTTVWTETGTAVATVSETATTALKGWQTQEGLTTSTQKSLTGTGGVTITTTSPDLSYQISIAQNDQPSSAISYGSDNQVITSTTYDYDGQGRLFHAIDARDGATTTTYYDTDAVKTVTQGDQVTGHHYDSMGREDGLTLPDLSVVNSLYWPSGELKSTGGSQTYPVSYTYDPQGRMKTMTAGTGTTTWNYDPARGWLNSKIYQDNKGTSYTYTGEARLKTRTWQRAITTTYGFNNAGEVNGLTYTDGTPPVGMTYDRLGRLGTMTDAAGTHTFAYAGLGGLGTETITGSGGILAGVTVGTSPDALLRRGSLSVQVGGTTVLSQGYGYDVASRLQTVTQGTRLATYGYVPNSNLVQTLTQQTTGSSTAAVLVKTKGYDLHDRLTSIGATLGSVTATSMGYGYNVLNQRQTATREDGSFWKYGYDGLGQVTSGEKYWSDSSAVDGAQYGYGFDAIGNRTSTVTNGRGAIYMPNSLNQYVQRTVPGAVDVTGEAETGATVTVNQAATKRHGKYFYRDLGVSNESGPVAQDVSTVGVKNGAGSAGEDAVTTKSGKVYVPKTPEIFGYDDDGNLTSDGRWSYTWDGENRLKTVTSIGSVPVALKKQLMFDYDGQSRRVQKRVYGWNTGTSTYVLSSTTKFVYDGWNLVAELNASNALVRSYGWGLDLSGSLQGAGGVGGLLTETDAATSLTYYPTYDGNGNVMSLLDASNGNMAASYEYGPFGESLKATGSYAAQSPWQFSTKYADVETGLSYYGYRYYQPISGKWSSRDPVEEVGGMNVYAIVGNRTQGYVDIDGRNGFSLVAGWVTGLGNDAYYYSGDSAAKEIMRGAVSVIIRNQIRNKLRENCQSGDNTPIRMRIRVGVSKLPKPLYALLVFPSELLYNSTSAAIGSFTRGLISVKGIDCCHKTADIHIHGINIMGLESLTHIPDDNGDYGASSIPDNYFGLHGPLHSIKQVFDWNEFISFSKDEPLLVGPAARGE